MKKILSLLGICVLFAANLSHAAFSEPSMADYTAIPISTAQSVPPNIMIMLDNSGSMNYNAYGTYPGDSGTVSDAPFTGEPYSGIKTFQVTSGQDDAEEGTAVGSVTYHNNGDLDLGGFNVASNDAIVGLRFQDVAIPQGVTIEAAYIEFMSNAYNDQTTNLLIEGEASDDAAPFDTVADNIKGRTATTASVAWNAVPTWSAGVAYPTADIKDILQEIVDRAGWASGNAMVFRISGTGGTDNKRDARAYNNNATTAPKLHVVFGNDPSATRYYGYFSPDYFYTYSNKFDMAYEKVDYSFAGSVWNVKTLAGAATTLDNAAIVSQGLWDGNWLNWLSMRRVDVLRKVLMGGLATARNGGGNQVNKGEIPAQSYRIFSKTFNSTNLSAVSPYHGNYSYRMEDGYIYRGATRYFIWVQKDSTREPDSFVNGNLAGLLQKVGDKARWGNIWFNGGTGSNQSGGTVDHTIGTNMMTLITELQNTGMDTWTPLAEAFYVAMQYFKQEDPAGGLDFPNNAVPNSNIGDDPYHNGTDYVPCAKSFVILLTDGASTKDAMIPNAYKDYDGDGKESGTCNETTCIYPSGGSDYLDDLALYARTVDLRSDLDGEQNLILYAIHAFDKDPNATSLLRDAARNGGFEDRDGDKKPDGNYASPANERLEWDKDGDGEPDTFFEADDGYSIEAKLLAAITDILKRASSGTTASVLATNNQGAGNSVQSYYRPMVTSGIDEAYWLGYLQSLWVDPWGNLREDSNGNLRLDLRSAPGSSPGQNTADGNVDKIVKMYNNGTDTILQRYTSHYLYNSDNGNRGDCIVADCTPVYEETSLNNLQPLFEAGKELSQTNPVDRKIFTYVGTSGVVASTDDTFDTSGDVILFNTATASQLKPFLGVSGNAAWGDSGAKIGSNADTRVSNIIDWIRGTDVTGLRNRTLDNVTWRLGDIVHATPLVVGPAREYYHLLYKDEEYIDFINYAKERETMIYVGANDGMLHAFTNYVLKKSADDQETLSYEPVGGTTEPIGTELWAYIPQSVLPHLKWTASVDYTHTYYVNGEPRIFDAKILPDDTYYVDGDANPNYGTFMVFGLNMGGKTISVNEDFGSGTNTVRSFSPTYVMMDITDPRNPRLMWERTYTGLGMSTGVPAPMRVGSLDGNSGKWFLVFGSGPSDYDYVSTQKGHMFVVDMLTGEPYGASGTDQWLWESSHNSYFNNPLAIDRFLSNNSDAVYLADNYYSSNQWHADVIKLAIPCSRCAWEDDPTDGTPYERDEYEYSDDPDSWLVSTLFEAEGPVTAKLTHTTDPLDNSLLYFGTGRFLNNADKTDTQQQYLYCVKDPFYNEYKYTGNAYHDFNNTLTLDHGDLLDTDNITVTTAGVVSGYPGQTDFWNFARAVRLNEDGWRFSLELNGSTASERIITQAAVLGGIFVIPTYTPSEEICAMGGTTSLLGGYYETGTAFKTPIFYQLAAGAPETVVDMRSPTRYIGMPPAKLVFHVGSEKGMSAFFQLSTAETIKIVTDPALPVHEGPKQKWDDPDNLPVANPNCVWQNQSLPAIP